MAEEETTGTPPAPGISADAGRNGRTQTLPTEAIGRLKKEAREKGKREAMLELETQAKEAGFGSLKEAFQAVADLKKAPVPETRQAAQAPAGKTNDPKWQKEIERREKLLQEAQRRLKMEERKRKELVRTMDQREVEQSIREQAILAGVQDVDFAVELARREARQIVNSVPPEKVEEALRQFDERKFFAGLRDKRPYLFGEKVVPATTGTAEAVGSTTPAPSPAKVVDAAAKGDQTDARKMSREQFAEHLAKLGLNPGA